MPTIKKNLGKDFSIISSNCFAGRIYQDLKIPYKSPTAGLFFFFDDFVEFIEHFDDYIHRNIIIVEKSKWAIANEKMKHRDVIYPIGQISGTTIEIHFLHYHTKEEALSKWERRSKRLNHNRLFIAFYQNQPSRESAIRFLKLKNTILFSTIQISGYDNCIYIEEFRKFKEAPNPYVYARYYYKYLAKFLTSHKEYQE